MGDSETPALGAFIRIELLRYKEKGAWLVLGLLICAVAYGKLVPAFLSALLQRIGAVQLPPTLCLALVIMLLHHACYVLHCLILRGLDYLNWSREIAATRQQSGREMKTRPWWFAPIRLSLSTSLCFYQWQFT